MPGLSDVDLAVVLAPDSTGPGAAGARARARWQRLRRAFPPADLLLHYPRIYDDDELREVVGGSAFAYALDGSAEAVPGRALYFGPGATPDAIRTLERPGLYGTTADWRLLSGADRRPPERDRDAQDRRIAAWLELLHWWHWAFPVCIDSSGPRTASLCLKLVTEPSRIWLWLAHGERASGRADVLHRALRRMPEEEDALRRALDLRDSLLDPPDPPLAEFVPVLVRLSARIAALIEAELEHEGATEVQLAGADPVDLVLAQGRWRPTNMLPGGRDPQVLPLCDWPSLARPRRPDEAFALLPGDPGDPAVLGAAAASQGAGPYPALRADRLMVLPAATRSRSRLRALKCRPIDPVSFALADGKKVASFPNVRGWSAKDTARRAVAEHRAWMRGGPSADGDTLAMLFTAVRAGLFLETIRGDRPELALTVTETARLLARRSSSARTVAEEALEGYRDFAVHRRQPPPQTVSAMQGLVLEMPAYADV
ncbi:MAG: hypothetical protein ACRDL1_00315 [Solirubrobacterales bacterium]